MAIKRCPKCNKEISSRSKKCVQCGYPLINEEEEKRKNKKRYKILVAGVCVTFVVLLTISLIWSDNDTQNESPNKVTYASGAAEEDVNDSFEDVKEVISIKQKKLFKTSNINFVLKGYNMAKKVKSKKSSQRNYDFFEAEAGKVFVDIIMDITNISHSSMKQDTVLSDVSLFVNDKQEYGCSLVVLDKNGNFISDTDVYDINPSEKLEYHMLTKVPSKLKNDKSKLKVQIVADENVYECALR